MIIDVLYEYWYKEREEHERQQNKIWITDLCRCPRKAEYEQRFPNLVQSFRPVYILGHLVHVGLQSILKTYKDVEIEAKGEKQLDDYTVVGRIDVLLGDIGVEIKYSRDDKYLPYNHHVLQCKLYNWLFELDRTYLFYVTPDRIAEYEITERATDDQVLKLIRQTKAPRFDWECRYCEFSCICDVRKRE